MARPTFPEDDLPEVSDAEAWLGMDMVTFAMAIVFIVGSAIFLAMVFVSSTMKGSQHTRK